MLKHYQSKSTKQYQPYQSAIVDPFPGLLSSNNHTTILEGSGSEETHTLNVEKAPKHRDPPGSGAVKISRALVWEQLNSSRKSGRGLGLSEREWGGSWLLLFTNFSYIHSQQPSWQGKARHGQWTGIRKLGYSFKTSWSWIGSNQDSLGSHGFCKQMESPGLQSEAAERPAVQFLCTSLGKENLFTGYLNDWPYKQ